MNYLKAYIPVFKLILTALTAFTVYRFCFLFFNHNGIPDHPDRPVFHFYRSLLYGVNFDLVIICYLISPFVIFCFISQFFPPRNQALFLKGLLIFKWYFIVLFSVCLLICAADIPYYKQFGTHLNKDAFVWGSSPGFVIQLIFSSVSYWGFLFLFMLLSYFMYVRISGIMNTTHAPLPLLKKTYAIGIFLVLALFTVIGARGRTALKSPIKTGTAFFSEYAFFNQLGLNPCFVFFSSLKQERQWGFLKTGTETDDLPLSVPSFGKEYTFQETPQKFNVMLVLMESMAMTKMGYHHCTHLTSHFDSLVKQGVFFDHFYAAGIHTFNGLFSTETGFPAIMNT
ncbi:MAG TPA: sulfatase-like hydrolase/transferase, partial [Bacteroidia bacterium]|nr:sulfatase-like hydrolase/transferase [Bacteroidia bacterium]